MPAIHEAARSGDADRVKELLAAGAEVDLVEEETGHTPLMAVCAAPDGSPAVLDVLLEAGAEIERLHEPPPEEPVDLEGLEEDAIGDLDLDPELVAAMQEMAGRGPEEPDRLTALALAVQAGAPLEVIQRLLAVGADVEFQSRAGYTLMTFAACQRRLKLLEILMAAGAPLDGESRWGESAVSVLSRWGECEMVGRLLECGADPGPLDWASLHRAVALGDRREVARFLASGAELDERDRWGRTPFLLAVHAGAREAAELLLERGADRGATGRCGLTAMHYAVGNGSVELVRWALAQGLAADEADEFARTPLMEAASAGATACFRLLIEAGADWRRRDHVDDGLVKMAKGREIIEWLHGQGENLGDLQPEVLRDFIGLGTARDLPVTREQYLAGRFRRFGTANPERLDLPFWNAMIRCGWSAYTAASQFGDSSFGRREPVWCHDRFGMSLTPLPDGRFVQVGGEHEDSYDPDFCIYNEVIVHDGKGSFEVFGYPEEIFPPTDFHSATLVGDWIYLIGNLGYAGPPEDTTPVFRLSVADFHIEAVRTHGAVPGWIHKHEARLEEERIVVSGGEHLSGSGEESELVPLVGRFALELAEGRWRKL